MRVVAAGDSEVGARESRRDERDLKPEVDADIGSDEPDSTAAGAVEGRCRIRRIGAGVSGMEKSIGYLKGGRWVETSTGRGIAAAAVRSSQMEMDTIWALEVESVK